MQSSPRGRLRVSSPVIYGTRVLVPALSGYLDRYPEVQIELSLNDRFVDLAKEGFDVAIRAGVLPDSGLIARALTHSPRIACASPAYGAPRASAGASGSAATPLLAFIGANGPEREWRFPRPDSNGVERIAVRGHLDVNGGLALREAALAGLGIILQPQVMLQDDRMRAGSSVSFPTGRPRPARPRGASARCAHAASW